MLGYLILFLYSIIAQNFPYKIEKSLKFKIIAAYLLKRCMEQKKKMRGLLKAICSYFYFFAMGSC